MTQYHLNEASLDLPSQLKDKTMHVFSLTDDGPSEFNVVISRADVVKEERLDEFSERLRGELSKALPKFELKGTGERKLGGSPAVELSYIWRNDGVCMQQRQVITLVSGPTPDRPQALMVTGTCIRAFNDHWNQAFDQLLDSVQLRAPLQPQTAQEPPVPPVVEPAAVAPAAPPEPIPQVFALAIRERTIYVYADQEQACRKVNAIEVEDGLWTFYGSGGQALEPVFIEPNTGRIWRSPGRYELRTTSKSNIQPLLSSLHQVMRIKGSYPFDSLTALQAHLERQKQLQHATEHPSDAER